MISPQTIEQIKNTVDIVDIIGDYVKLKKRGANYLGNCPFHNEKTPSFTVSKSKDLFKCFGCGKSGNTIGFIMEHDKLTYVESLRFLANKYNIAIEETEISYEKKVELQTAESLHIINKFAANFFVEQLNKTEEGQTIAQTYLDHRKINKSIAEKFLIGYNPQAKDSLAKEFLKHQYNVELFSRTGLVVMRNDAWTDNYRGRIIFPIHSINGKIIGFGARVIGNADAKTPKYINTPENEVYVKSKLLYGMYQAKNGISKLDECLLVEGYTDVVSLHQAGIENVVASGGTSLTTDQLRLIKKYTNNLTIIYDGDSAGIKAAMRGLDMALEENLNVKLVLIPDGEDPDSYVQKVGTETFNNFVANNKKDFILFQLEIMLADAGNDINKRNLVVQHIAETLTKINQPENFLKLSEYVKRSATILQIDEAALTNLINKLKRDKIAKQEKKMSFDEANFLLQEAIAEPIFPEENMVVNEDEAVEENIIKTLLQHGFKPYNDLMTFANFIKEELEQFEIETPVMLQVYNEYFIASASEIIPDIKWLEYSSNDTFRALALKIKSKNIEPNEKWYDKSSGLNTLKKDNALEEVIMSVCYFKLRKIKKLITQNHYDISNSNNTDQQLQLITVHHHLKMIEKQITEKLGTVIYK